MAVETPANVKEIRTLPKGGSWTGLAVGSFDNPYAVAVVSSDALYVTDFKTNGTGTINKLAKGNTAFTMIGDSSDGFTCSRGVAVDSAGVVYATDTADHRVRSYPGSSSRWDVIGGNGLPGNSDINLGQFNTPEGVAADSSGFSVSIYVADTEGNSIRKLAGRPLPQAPL